MRKKRVYLAAVNQRYGRNAFLPYAAGLIWGYAIQSPEIVEAYELGGFLYAKEPIERAVSRLDSPDVLALSSYIWNHEWNKALARAVKRRWPGCAVLIGGVQVPEGSPRALEECNDFDFAIYGEGERAFANFLRVYNRSTSAIDFSSCGSLIWHAAPGSSWSMITLWNERRRQGKVDRASAIRVNLRGAETPIESIPSPYLLGLFDGIVASRPDLKFQALQETNRGCPYACTFCAWGAASLSKLRQFPTERVIAEYEWMAAHGIEFLYNCDANYGILKRDVELTEALIKVKERRGLPKQFRAAYAKNSNDVVFDISKALHDAGMLKATTLALQSNDDGVLVNIKRKNIKHDRFAELSQRYEAAGIATYVELIVGLPGETLNGFIAGIDGVLDAGQHDGVSIYLCMLLENTEMAAPEYRQAHAIETVPMKALLYHGCREPGVVEEVQATVVATATMPRDDLRSAVLYGWFVQALHSFGLTQRIARRMHDERAVRYRDFYEPLMAWLLYRPDTVGGRELRRAAALWDAAVRGESWATVDPLFGEVSWPPEELLFLRIAVDSDRFYDELVRFWGAWSDKECLVGEQRRLFIPPTRGKEEEYAREAVWFGRKGPGRRLRLRS